VDDSDLDSDVDSFLASDSDGSNRRRKKGKRKGRKGEKKGVSASSSSSLISLLGDETEDLTQEGGKGSDRRSPKKVPTPKKANSMGEKDEDIGVLTVDDPEEEEAAKAISDLKVRR
jgi:hypothetical protein